MAPASLMMPSAAVARPATIARSFDEREQERRLAADGRPARGSAPARRDRRRPPWPGIAPRSALPAAVATISILSRMPLPVCLSGTSTNGMPAAAQHRDGFFRSGVLGREDERRIEPEHAFRRQRAHVADVRLLAQRLRRIEARGVDGDDALLEPERVEDFGDRAADRDDAGVVADGDRLSGGVAHDDRIAMRRARGREQNRQGECEAGSSCGYAVACRLSLGEDQLVLGGQAQPVDIGAVSNGDLARADEQVAAVDPVGDDIDLASFGRRCERLSRRISRLFLAWSPRSSCDVTASISMYSLFDFLV